MFFARNVKVLAVDIGCEAPCRYWLAPTRMAVLFSVCTGVCRFVLRGVEFNSLIAGYILSCSQLRHLHVGVAEASPQGLEALANDFVLDKLTHMSFEIFDDDNPPQLLERLFSSAPNLTHVAGEGSTDLSSEVVLLLEDVGKRERIQTVILQAVRRREELEDEGDDEFMARMKRRARGIHPDYGVCVVRAHDHVGPPTIDGSVTRTDAECSAWNDVLYLPDAPNVWQIADQTLVAKREALRATLKDLRDKIALVTCMIILTHKNDAIERREGRVPDVSEETLRKFNIAEADCRDALIQYRTMAAKFRATWDGDIEDLPDDEKIEALVKEL